MDTELRASKDSAKAPGQDRIYVAGEIEHAKTLYNREHGVPVHVKVWTGLEKMAGELGLPFDIEKH
jgi:LDH2 family malate/lactate/ureidoglycolate dehydrogenase